MSKKKVKPRYKHNHCDQCRFVGQAANVDVWICEQQDSLIARNGNEPWEYGSHPRKTYKQMRETATEQSLVNLFNTVPYYKIWDKLAEDPKYTA